MRNLITHRRGDAGGRGGDGGRARVTLPPVVVHVFAVHASAAIGRSPVVLAPALQPLADALRLPAPPGIVIIIVVIIIIIIFIIFIFIIIIIIIIIYVVVVTTVIGNMNHPLIINISDNRPFYRVPPAFRVGRSSACNGMMIPRGKDATEKMGMMLMTNRGNGSIRIEGLPRLSAHKGRSEEEGQSRDDTRIAHGIAPMSAVRGRGAYPIHCSRRQHTQPNIIV
jgi:hypothetical protein